ncbi:hypothetical protein Scep_017406 [Stephania cephalantha]|uniref:Uncharacterized protein n=1 Tax=Stephania cephalantha TaxID=152367 RepID=A0AAP0IQV0_9MAGN
MVPSSRSSLLEIELGVSNRYRTQGSHFALIRRDWWGRQPLVVGRAVGGGHWVEQWFAVGGDDDRWWSEATTKGVGRPQTATASRRQWEASRGVGRRWTQQWRVGDSGGGEGGTGGTMRCEAAVRGGGGRKAAVRAVEGDDDGNGFGGGR